MSQENIVRFPRRPLNLHVLTRSEREILGLLVEGLDVKSVARYRCCSTYTVRNHLKAMYRKLEVSGLGEILVRYWRDGQISESNKQLTLEWTG